MYEIYIMTCLQSCTYSQFKTAVLEYINNTALQLCDISLCTTGVTSVFVLHYWPMPVELTLFETTLLNFLLAANIITQALH
jgi:hypothetical protein